MRWELLLLAGPFFPLGGGEREREPQSNLITLPTTHASLIPTHPSTFSETGKLERLVSCHAHKLPPHLPVLYMSSSLPTSLHGQSYLQQTGLLVTTDWPKEFTCPFVSSASENIQKSTTSTKSAPS